MNFDTQWDLSCRQLHWQELLSQYEIHITYIQGEDNTVVNALSWLPSNVVPTVEPHVVWRAGVNATSSISTDSAILQAIMDGYKSDPFCKKFAKVNIPGAKLVNGLWYVGSRLLIPRVGDVWEQLFCLSHDTLGHFRAYNSYVTLRNAYYWLNMRRDLGKAYIPSCVDCQRNKSPTTKPPGPLHPLPVPDECSQSIAMDFVGPLKEDLGFNCILLITDQLGADIRIIPTRTDISTENLAVLFFDHWYCENGLPLNIVCDCNKLFISRFWKTLTELCGVKLKMSTAYHPETDRSSKHTNKTINQSLCFHANCP